MARSTGLLAALETGRCRVASYLPEFEVQAVTLEAGQHQPDRVAVVVVVVAFDVLSHSIGQQMGAGVTAGQREARSRGHDHVDARIPLAAV